jgi:hypothetical protein
MTNKIIFLVVSALISVSFSSCKPKEEAPSTARDMQRKSSGDDWVLFEDDRVKYLHPPNFQTGTDDNFWMTWVGGPDLQGAIKISMRWKGKNLEEYHLASKKEFPTTAHSKPVKQRFPYSDCVWFTYKDHRANGVEAHCYSRSGKYFESLSSFTRADARDDEKDKEYLRNFQKFLKSVEIK